jgi:hypothetical protein
MLNIGGGDMVGGVSLTLSQSATLTIIIGSRMQKPSRKIHIALANVDRLFRDVKTISNKGKPKGSMMDLMTVNKIAKNEGYPVDFLNC